MRRGTLNNKAIIFLVIGSVFTFLSFLFDQLVIQTEDKIRDLSYKYEETFNNYSTSKTILYTTQELSNRIRIKQMKYDFQSDFLQDAIMLIKFSPEVYADYFQGTKGDEYNKNLEEIFISKYLIMYRNLIDESFSAHDLLLGLPIRALDKELLPKNNERIAELVIEASKILNDGAVKYGSEAIQIQTSKIKSLDDFLNTRKKFNDFLGNFLSSATKVNEINKIYGDLMNLFFQKTQVIIIDKIKAQNNRNVFILLSVICQITGLLFLLMLFKTLLKHRNPEGV